MVELRKANGDTLEFHKVWNWGFASSCLNLVRPFSDFSLFLPILPRCTRISPRDSETSSGRIPTRWREPPTENLRERERERDIDVLYDLKQ